MFVGTDDLRPENTKEDSDPMRKSIRACAAAGVAVGVMSAATAYGFKEYCDWQVGYVAMDEGRSMAVSFFEHPNHPQAVKAYVDSLKETGAWVITQSDLAQGVEIPPLEKGKSLVFVFEQQPDHMIRAHFPSPKTDLHIVEIGERDRNDAVRAVKANYTSQELDEHSIEEPGVEALVDAYLAHWKKLGSGAERLKRPSTLR